MKLPLSLSGRSVNEFRDLGVPKQFGRLLTSKERNRCNILPEGLGGSTVIKICGIEVGRVACFRHGCITQAFLLV